MEINTRFATTDPSRCERSIFTCRLPTARAAKPCLAEDGRGKVSSSSRPAESARPMFAKRPACASMRIATRHHHVGDEGEQQGYDHQHAGRRGVKWPVVRIHD